MLWKSGSLPTRTDSRLRSGIRIWIVQTVASRNMSGLDVVGAMHADGGNQETCEGRADGARAVESHRVERQRIEEVSWPGDVTHQGLARRVLKCLHSAGQEAGHVNMPWLDTIRKDERRQDEVEESVGDLGDDELCFTTGAIGQRARNDAEEEKRNAAHRGGKTQLKR